MKKVGIIIVLSFALFALLAFNQAVNPSIEQERQERLQVIAPKQLPLDSNHSIHLPEVE